MRLMARIWIQSLSESPGTNILRVGSFVADMAALRLERRYDAVLCLGSSIGYLRNLAAVKQAFECLRAHLRADGVVIVEPWFPPEVLESGYEATTEIIERISRLRFEYTIETQGQTRRASEVHELGLFTVTELLDAFTERRARCAPRPARADWSRLICREACCLTASRRSLNAMSDASDQRLLDAVLDSWDRNNTILLNLLRAIPEGLLEARPMESSPSIVQLFTHIHYVRLVFVCEDAPEFTRKLPEGEWVVERDRGRLAQMLNDSATAVRDAVKSRLETGRDMDVHYDHPILMLQHMVWHEGYHHGQIKLALKLAGRPITDDEAGPVTWDVWMDKT